MIEHMTALEEAQADKIKRRLNILVRGSVALTMRDAKLGPKQLVYGQMAKALPGLAEPQINGMTPTQTASLLTFLREMLPNVESLVLDDEQFAERFFDAAQRLIAAFK